jgi:hypothetical protein
MAKVSGDIAEYKIETTANQRKGWQLQVVLTIDAIDILKNMRT